MNSSSSTELAYSAIQCFTDDGTLDVGEINFLLGIAMSDGEVDEEERRVLGNIFSKVTKAEVDNNTWNRIQEVKSKHAIA